MLEVEIKAALTGHTKEQFKKAAEKLGFIKGGTLQEIDVYFNGNDRNFMKTDEALRLRSSMREPAKPSSPTKAPSWIRRPAQGWSSKLL